MQSLNEKYLNVTKRLESDNKLIIQAFINFYGEQYSKYIIEKLNNSRIIWYDDAEYKDNDDIHNYIISSFSISELDKILNKRSEKAFLQSAYIDELDLLVLPLSYDLTHIIHEFNHKISSHIISLEPLEQINGINYSKEVSSSVVMEYDEYLNEAINQKMTLEVLNELSSLGINVQITSSWQEHLFPLVNSFYEIFKSLLKEIYISGDLDNLKKSLGEVNYECFSQIIYLKAFKIRRILQRNKKPEISQNDIDLIAEIVYKMKSYYDIQNTNDIKKVR